MIPDNEFTNDLESQPTMDQAYGAGLKIVAGRHPVEKKYPEQCAEFRRLLGVMYQKFLDKNQDYGPHNVGATGQVGIIVRSWDKMARLMHLSGFDILTGEYTGEKDAVNEPIEDAWLDKANYSLIALILRAGRWGR